MQSKLQARRVAVESSKGARVQTHERSATPNTSKTTDIKPTNNMIPPMQPVCLPICRLRLTLMLKTLA
jgi:hypothetical protein